MTATVRRTRSAAPPTATLPVDAARVRLLANAIVVAEPGRCVQCGICSHSCPSGIDVREIAREGLAVTDARCLLCGSCVARCPRGTLSFRWLEEQR
jgi:NAD-dependent dihydropyrimidine dehydrogenase PreA subunit